MDKYQVIKDIINGNHADAKKEILKGSKIQVAKNILDVYEGLRDGYATSEMLSFRAWVAKW